MTKRRTSRAAGESWFSRQDCARFVGMKPDNLDKQYRGLLPDDAVEKRGNVIFYHTPTLLELVIEKRGGQSRLDDDALLSGEGGDSPSLERLRRAKAEIAELDLAERKKEVVTRLTVVELLARAHGGLRGLIERWERRHRQSEAQELRDALHLGLKALSKELGEDVNLSR